MGGLVEFLEIFGNIFLFIGLFFIFSSFIGIIRFKGALPKLHAVGVSDVFGIPFFLFGLGIKSNDVNMFLKYCLLIVIVFISSPIITHNIARFIHKEESEHVKSE